jgi:hypothetical protein
MPGGPVNISGGIIIQKRNQKESGISERKSVQQAVLK